MAGDNDTDDSQKTEEPSQRKLEKAFEEGNVVKSQEVTHAVMLAAVLALVAYGAAPFAALLGRNLVAFVERPHSYSVDAAAMMRLTQETSFVLLLAFGIPAAAMMLMAVIGNLLQHPPTFTAKTMEPKLQKIDPMAGLKRIFGQEALLNLAKAIAKLLLVSAVTAFVLWPDRNEILALLDHPPIDIIVTANVFIVRILLAVVCIMIIIALIDLAYQRQRHHEKLKMSRKELLDEHKDSEGDPHIKQKIRQIRAERSRQRMMQAVPGATVVVTNPTHFSVALKYVEGETRAPLCVAKGADELALRIRLVAKDNKVPIVENVPLARALFAGVDVDEEIPEEHYKAVAEVISYVLRLRTKGRPPPRR